MTRHIGANAVQQIRFISTPHHQVRIGLNGKWCRYVSSEIGDRALEQIVERIKTIGIGNVRVTGRCGNFRFIFMNQMGNRYVPLVEVQCVNWKLAESSQPEVWHVTEGRNAVG